MFEYREHKQSRYVYVSNSAGNTIYQFTVNADGSLTANGSISTNSNLNQPVAMVADLSGSFLYAINAANGTGNGTVSVFNIQAHGTLAVSSSNATASTGNTPSYASFDPTGEYLYVPNSGDSTISEYSVTAGVLQPIGTVPAITGALSLANVIIDPTGTYAYLRDSGDGGNGQIFGFKMGGGGLIGAALNGSPFATGNFPRGSFAIDPTSAIIANENNGDAAITVYVITPSTGSTPGAPTGQVIIGTHNAPLRVIFFAPVLLKLGGYSPYGTQMFLT